MEFYSAAFICVLDREMTTSINLQQQGDNSACQADYSSWQSALSQKITLVFYKFLNRNYGILIRYAALLREHYEHMCAHTHRHTHTHPARPEKPVMSLHLPVAKMARHT